jgi:hypothetical protein
LAEIEKVEALVSNGGQLQTAQQFAKAIDLYGECFSAVQLLFLSCFAQLG